MDLEEVRASQDGENGGETARWTGAVGNIEDARVALDTLARAIDDAVYLDEDAYNQVAPVMQYQKTIQVLHHIDQPSRSVYSCFELFGCAGAATAGGRACT